MQQAILTVWAMSLAVVGAISDEPRQSVGLGGSGGMFALAVSPLDPQLMMLNCDMSGAYITRDGGRTWRMTHHRMLRSNTRCSPLFHPTVPGRIYAVSGDANELRLSEDAGTTWRPLLKDRAPWRGPIWLLQTAADEPDGLFVSAADETFVTLDGGSTWHRCEGVQGRAVGIVAQGVQASSPEGKYNFIATSAGLFRSRHPYQAYVSCGGGLPPGLLGCTGGALGSDPFRPGPIYLQGDHPGANYRDGLIQQLAQSDQRLLRLLYAANLLDELLRLL